MFLWVEYILVLHLLFGWLFMLFSLYQDNIIRKAGYVWLGFIGFFSLALLFLSFESFYHLSENIKTFLQYFSIFIIVVLDIYFIIYSFDYIKNKKTKSIDIIYYILISSISIIFIWGIGFYNQRLSLDIVDSPLISNVDIIGLKEFIILIGFSFSLTALGNIIINFIVTFKLTKNINKFLSHKFYFILISLGIIIGLMYLANYDISELNIKAKNQYQLWLALYIGIGTSIFIPLFINFFFSNKSKLRELSNSLNELKHLQSSKLDSINILVNEYKKTTIYLKKINKKIDDVNKKGKYNRKYKKT